jgi:hypothetical protein
MTAAKRFRITGTRLAGMILAVGLGAGLAASAGVALASPGSPGAAMAGMAPASAAHKGFTKGWYDRHTVRFYYTRNFFCRKPPASGASSRCEAGADYTQTPANTFDPLYVVVPLGFTPPKSTIQCPAGNCIDHPHTIDLSAVLGNGTSNVLLPAHSHIVATNNGHQAEWWNVDVVGVKTLKAWTMLVRHKTDWELRHLQRTDSQAVTGNITTNLFLYFAVLR